MAQSPPSPSSSSLSLPDNPIAARMYYTRHPSIMTERAYIYDDIKGWSRANDEDKHRTKLLVSSFFHRKPKNNNHNHKKKRKRRNHQKYQYNYHLSTKPSDTIHYTVTPKIRKHDPFLVHGIRLNEQLGKTITTSTTSTNLLATNTSTIAIIDNNSTINQSDIQILQNKTKANNNNNNHDSSSCIMAADDDDTEIVVQEQYENNSPKKDTFFKHGAEYRLPTTNKIDCHQRKEPVQVSMNNNNKNNNNRSSNENNEKGVIVSRKTPPPTNHPMKFRTHKTTAPSRHLNTTTPTVTPTKRLASTVNNNTKQVLQPQQQQKTISKEPIPIRKLASEAPALDSPKQSLLIRPPPPSQKNNEQMLLESTVTTDVNRSNINNSSKTSEETKKSNKDISRNNNKNDTEEAIINPKKFPPKVNNTIPQPIKEKLISTNDKTHNITKILSKNQPISLVTPAISTTKNSKQRIEGEKDAKVLEEKENETLPKNGIAFKERPPVQKPTDNRLEEEKEERNINHPKTFETSVESEVKGSLESKKSTYDNKKEAQGKPDLSIIIDAVVEMTRSIPSMNMRTLTQQPFKAFVRELVGQREEFVKLFTDCVANMWYHNNISNVEDAFPAKEDWKEYSNIQIDEKAALNALSELARSGFGFDFVIDESFERYVSLIAPNYNIPSIPDLIGNW